MQDMSDIKRTMAKDKIFTGIIVTLAFVSMIPLILILGYIFMKGFPVLSAKFFALTSPSTGVGSAVYDTLSGAAKADAVGGVANALVGSLLIVGVAILIAIPLGVLMGIFLAENQEKKFAQIAEVAVDMIQGIPSVIIGIVLSLWMVRTFKVFAISGSIALSIMMLPIVIKNTEESIKLVPGNLKEAALALGAPYYRVVLQAILPSSLSGVVTGILVGTSRILGETAPLIFTASVSPYLRTNLLEKMHAMPTLVYNGAMSPYPNIIDNAWGASCVLVILVLLVNLISKWVVSKWKVKF